MTQEGNKHCMVVGKFDRFSIQGRLFILSPIFRFGGNINHDPHMLYTLSAIQILALANQLDRVDNEKVAYFISSLQQPDGSFYGDKWGEVDTRFSYCALSAMSLLGRLESKDIDVLKAVEYVGRWKYFTISNMSALFITSIALKVLL